MKVKSLRLAATLIYMLSILMGMMLLIALFIVPYFAELVMDISDGQTALPYLLRVVFDISVFLGNNGMLFGVVCVILFAGSLVWRLRLRNECLQKA